MRSALVAALVLATGCGGPQTVAGSGAMTALLNQELARTTAQNRALANAQALATLGGIGFTFSKSRVGDALEITQPESALPIVNTEFTPVPDGWVATVFVQRSEEVAREMERLETVSVEARSTGANLPAAMRDAKREALRSLLRRSLGELPTGITTGAITLTEMRYLWPETLSGDEIEVGIALTGNVRVEGTRALAEADAERIAERLLTEQTRAGLWTEALGSVEGFLADHPTNRRFGTLRAGIQLRLNDREKAKDGVMSAFRDYDWERAQEVLAQVEPLLGIETADEIRGLAVESGVIAPPSVGPDPAPAAVEEPPRADSPAKTGAKRKKKRRRRRRK